MDNSPIVKCSHCKQVLSSKDFDTHECDILIKDSEIIEVAYFRDDSYKDKRLMTGMGLDGVLYTFEKVPRKPIPFIASSSDGFLQRKKSDKDLTEPEKHTLIYFVEKLVPHEMEIPEEQAGNILSSFYDFHNCDDSIQRCRQKESEWAPDFNQGFSCD